MSTVGRIGCIRALTKVLTRSRGTPAAAFAMYCSRKVLVDTELVDYNPCPPGEEERTLDPCRVSGRSGDRDHCAPWPRLRPTSGPLRTMVPLTATPERESVGARLIREG